MNTRIPRKAFFLTAMLALSAAIGRPAGVSKVEKVAFGTADGKAVDLYVLSDSGGMVAKIMTYGATVTELDTPDREGSMDDVVLGFDSLAGYLGKEPYFGAIVGRVGNRIAKGRFTLDGHTYQLATNDGPNHLHGGIRGFDKVVWDAEVIPGDAPSVKFTYLSKDGEEGYPGNCHVTVVYTIANSDELRIDYTITTDKDTPVNVTNHSYFNLGGPEKGSILGHILTLNADKYTVVDDTLIPTGELRAVAGTPMDFRSPMAIGSRISQVGSHPIGYDHNYVINAGPQGLNLVGSVYDPQSGRAMEVSSTESGVQFYSGNFLDGTITGKKGVVYKQYWGIALETQHFPDAMNHPEFASDVLKAGQTYRSTTIYRFSARPKGQIAASKI
jgi:aldose 1-epimerase